MLKVIIAVSLMTLVAPYAARAANLTDPLATCAVAAGDPADAPLVARTAAANAPLIIFVHGGAWTRGDKMQIAPLAPAFTAAGYAFASVGYRLAPQADVATQALDVCQAVQSLRRRAAQLGVDPRKVVLMGHSAGAQLAAAVAPRLGVRALVLLDPVGVSVGDELRQNPGISRVFGADPARWRFVSPADEARAGAAYPPTFIAATDFRQDTVPQAQAFAAALRPRQPDVTVKTYPGLRHGNFFMNLARPQPLTADVFAFLQRTTR